MLRASTRMRASVWLAAGTRVISLGYQTFAGRGASRRYWHHDGMSPMTVRLGPAPLTAAEVVAVARGGEPIELTEESLTEMARSRAIVERLAESPEPAYGISTGFGALATVHIPPESRAHLQESLIRSHAAGWGPEVEPEVVRATMLRVSMSTLVSPPSRPNT